MLARMDPFRDLRTAEDEIEWLFGRAFAGHVDAPLDVNESDDGFEVKVDLPGLGPDDVNVTFEDGMLTVGGKRQFETENTGQTWHRVERGFGTFARSIRLPQTADTESIEASFDKGVLTVVVPKSERAKAKTNRSRPRSRDGRTARRYAGGGGRRHSGRLRPFRRLRGHRAGDADAFDSRPPGGPPSIARRRRAQSDAAAEGNRGRRTRYRRPAPR